MHKCVAKYGTFMYYWYRVTRGWTIMTQEKTLNPSEKFFLAAWQAAAGSSNILKKLTASGHLPSELWQMPDDALSGILQEKPEHLARALAIRYRKPELPEILAEECQRLKIRLCAFSDEEYPPMLREIYDPPQVLYYRGKLFGGSHRLAVVGSRRVTPYGRAAAEAIAADLSKAGFCIVSGGAAGTDTFSHKGALKNGITEAVLGCGADVVYPAANARLFDEIAEKGAVISEYPPGTKPERFHFPARNRIISGMSQGTLVIEAAKKSGSLITAEQAISCGRDVFAVPGSIFSQNSIGTNILIQQGAKLVMSADDVLAEYPEVPAAGNAAAPGVIRPELTEDEKRILDVLYIEEPSSIDIIIYKLNGTNTANVAFQLLQMELKGLICRDDNQGYTRRPL